MTAVYRLFQMFATLLCMTALPVHAAESPKPNSRAEVTKIIQDVRQIVTPEGIEKLETVRIGGIDQWISVRGNDRRNPILLYLHGGPGYVMLPTSWYFQRGWEEYFTVVQWDQRGAGKTHISNASDAVIRTITFEQLLSDTEEMIAHLRKTYGKEKIFVVGHSWGSYLGLKTAQRHPEWLHAYIGMGQVVDAMESERRGWRFAMDQAEQTKNELATKELQSIAPYAQPGRPIPAKDIYLQRKWVSEFGGVIGQRKNNDAVSAAAHLSPDYTDDEIKHLWDGNRISGQLLLSQIVALDLSDIRELKCPMILFNGRDDHTVSSTVAAEWFETLEAPSKSLVWFEHVAHEPPNEAPGKTLLSLVRYARPFAEQAGDVAPL